MMESGLAEITFPVELIPGALALVVWLVLAVGVYRILIWWWTR